MALPVPGAHFYARRRSKNSPIMPGISPNCHRFVTELA